MNDSGDDREHTIVAVFGGSGFLGRRVVARLLEHGFTVRAVSRHPDRARRVPGERERLSIVRADIHDPDSAAAAIEGAGAVVNAVSLYVEHDAATFRSVHVEAAGALARLCREMGVQTLVQVSGIGADAASSSRYIRARGEGELAVRAEFPEAVVVRPSVMFAPDDAFLTALVRLVRMLPVFPLFGAGETRLQPVHAEDVAEAIARIVTAGQGAAPTYEFGGPQVYAYGELVERIAEVLSVRRLLMPVPFLAWKGIGAIAERTPWPAVTVNQVELMEQDTLASGPGLSELGVTPRPLEDTLATIVRSASGVR